MRGLLKALLYLVTFSLCLLAVAALLITPWFSLSPLVLAAKILLLAALLLVFLWLAWRGLRLFLWRVGRRLAFSYFLIGVLPIPMVILLVGLNAYLLSGFFLGHLYRDAVSNLRQELTQAARQQVWTLGASGTEPELSETSLAVAIYRQGRRVGGDQRAPASWPSWLEGEQEAGASGPSTFSFVALPDGSPTLAAIARRGETGVLVFIEGDIQRELTRRSDVWVVLLRAEDPRKEGGLRLRLGSREFALTPVAARADDEGRSRFFNLDREDLELMDRPLLWWGELTGPLRSLAEGVLLSESVAASLNGNIRIVHRHLFSGSAEVDAAIWGGLISVTGLLSTIYGLAALMAVFIIFGLSRAVNRLSRATAAVQRGDFATRIPVRRKDQVGELQRSFNQMTANLETMVASTAQKEALEKELAIARDLQQSLLPVEMPASDKVDFATLFEPSAAIGGDYFDILRLDKHRLAVVIADVSGHGLPTGLRMAMLKAALVILIEESKPPETILERLDEMVRSERRQRFFVTATIGVVDFRSGELELTNAGHPPTYLVRRAKVEEILLPGSPLGALGDEYGRYRAQLEPGDFVVWLSDGLIEAAGAGGEPFGYERVQAALATPAASAEELRDALLESLKRHTGTRPSQDDKTLIVMRYRPEPGASRPSAE